MSLLISTSTSSLKPFFNQLDFLLPGLFVHEPGILGDLPGAFDVLLVQFDLHAGPKLAAALIQTAQPQETRIGDSHAARLVGKINSIYERSVIFFMSLLHFAMVNVDWPANRTSGNGGNIRVTLGVTLLPA